MKSLVGRGKSQKRRRLKKFLGLLLIIVGVAGLFLPFLQGILLIVLGMALYENKSVKDVRESVKEFIRKLRRKFRI